MGEKFESSSTPPPDAPVDWGNLLGQPERSQTPFDLVSLSALKPEPGAKAAESAGQVSASEGKDGTLHLKINSPVKEGSEIAFGEPIAIGGQGSPSNNANAPDRGHLLHVQFQARSEAEGGKLLAEIVGANAPYTDPMKERVDLTPDWKTYDFYTAAPDADLRFKFDAGREQSAGQIDIKDLHVTTAVQAPATETAAPINPADVGEAAVAARINENRKDNLNITVTDHDGRPVAGHVKVEETSSDFLFGGNVSQLGDRNIPMPDGAYTPDQLQEYKQKEALTPEQKELYKNAIVDFGTNMVTVPIYWSQHESAQGQTDYKDVDESIAWAKAHDMQVKLHPVVWPDTYPKWAGGTADDAQKQIHKHIDEVIARYGDKVDYIEVNELNSSEQLQHPVREAAAAGGIGPIVKDDAGHPVMQPVQNGLTEWIKEAGPAAVFETTSGWMEQDLKAKGANHAQIIENEYDIDNKTLSTDKRLMKDGSLPDGGLGVQMHMFNGDYPKLEVWQKLQNLDQFGKPVLITETTVPDHFGKGDPVNQEKQEQELKALYDVAMSDPNVKGVSLWDMTDKNAWNQGTGGPLDANMQRKEWFNLLKKNYWSNESVTTGSDGKAKERVFKGEYRLTLTDDRGNPVLGADGKPVSAVANLHGNGASVNLEEP